MQRYKTEQNKYGDFNKFNEYIAEGVFNFHTTIKYFGTTYSN